MSRRPTRDVIVWSILLACLTITGAIWIDAHHLGYQEFSPGIPLIGFSPALAAIVTAALVSGRGGLRCVTGQTTARRIDLRAAVQQQQRLPSGGDARARRPQHRHRPARPGRRRPATGALVVLLVDVAGAGAVVALTDPRRLTRAH